MAWSFSRTSLARGSGSFAGVAPMGSTRSNARPSPQDLKDFGREGGNVSYADIDRDHPGDG
jgi:hypothetical protein